MTAVVSFPDVDRQGNKNQAKFLFLILFPLPTLPPPIYELNLIFQLIIKQNKNPKYMSYFYNTEWLYIHP